ncbi:peptidyl-prolyl cis-trans isomerase C [Terrimicrobium sacchariphilum]|uniref:Peptidyl-prolyl cis-trans isomerase C n=1 Tax=Terrimicrobium sacchariphilum TaxID=690879 RepID=A0A146GEG3_TERSA|nr:peptidylprolyl isomerase [Terrimicrobium sacchariphilum]GAT35522.1 peptidyl-prolyl cis-trans isomerase C [Terrimicrobium sacchariphilum]
MKKSLSLVLCSATAAAATLAMTSCKPSQPAASEPAAAPSATPVAAAASPAPAASATPADASAPVSPLGLKDPVAVVNGEPISLKELQEAFETAVKSSGVDAASLTDAQKIEGYHQLLDELIVDKLIAKQAASVEISQADVDAEVAKIKKQFPTEEDFNKQLAQVGQSPEKVNETIKKMLQQQRWVESQVADKVAVTPEDAQKFYNDNKQEFKEDASVRASHILIRVDENAPEDVVKQKQAEAAKVAALASKKGADFAALAKQYSEEPGAKDSGGDLDFFTKDRMVPEFAEAAFSQKVGQVSQPVRTQFGWHVIKVTDTKPARVLSFDEVKGDLTNYLKRNKQREAVQNLIKGLRDGAKVENNLPPAPEAPAAPADAVTVPTVDPAKAPGGINP